MRMLPVPVTLRKDVSGVLSDDEAQSMWLAHTGGRPASGISSFSSMISEATWDVVGCSIEFWDKIPGAM